jgi:transposase
MPRYPITDAQWAAISELFPQRERSNFGRPSRDARTIVNAILWVQEDRTRKWQHLPPDFGPSQTAYIKWLQWRRSGLMDRIMAALDHPPVPDSADYPDSPDTPDANSTNAEPD